MKSSKVFKQRKRIIQGSKNVPLVSLFENDVAVLMAGSRCHAGELVCNDVSVSFTKVNQNKTGVDDEWKIIQTDVHCPP